MALAQEGYLDRRLGHRVIKVLPGDYRVQKARSAGAQTLLATTLGSCVAACLYEEGTGIGGMNHFLLPDGDREAGARYGVHAMELLINGLLRLGATRAGLRAKVFGGAAVLAAVTRIDVGRKNAAFVHDFLEVEGIPILGEDLGGRHPRKLLFYPWSGEARVRLLPLTEGDSVIAEERHYRTRVRTEHPKPQVELF